MTTTTPQGCVGQYQAAGSVALSVHDTLSTSIDGPYARRFLYHLAEVAPDHAALSHDAQVHLIKSYWDRQVRTVKPRAHLPALAEVNVACLIQYIRNFVTPLLSEYDLPRLGVTLN